MCTTILTRQKLKSKVKQKSKGRFTYALVIALYLSCPAATEKKFFQFLTKKMIKSCVHRARFRQQFLEASSTATQGVSSPGSKLFHL